MLFVLIGALGVFVLVAYFSYNRLIRMEQQTIRSWSNIEVLLKQRYDEISALVDVASQYAQFEAHVFEKLAQARTYYGGANDIGEKIKASHEMSVAIRGVLGIAENYPDLKSNSNFLNLQSRISVIEESLADRRESYNDAVSIFNAQIRQLPDVFMAGLMGLKAFEIFKAAEAERQLPSVKMNIPGTRSA